MLTLGDASIACIPGEIYPEIVNGGIETPPGADFPVEPIEVPPVREFMPRKHKFIFGLANDEIGYIIPRSEWDQKAPYLYNSEKGVYGEINSVGPAAAEIIHRELKALAAEMKYPTRPTDFCRFFLLDRSGARRLRRSGKIKKQSGECTWF